MSETITQPTLTAPPAIPAELAAHRANWMSHGFDPAAFDAALAGQSPAPSSTPAAETPPAPLEVTPRIRLDQALRMAEALRQQNVPEEQIQAALAAHGYDLGTDTRSAEERAHDANHGFDRHYSADEYAPSFYGRIVPGTLVAEVAKLNAEASEFLAALQIPPAIGNSLIEHMVDTARSLAKLSPEAQARIDAQNRIDRVTRAGSEQAYKDQVALVRQYLDQAPKSDLISTLLNKGGFDNFVFRTLVNLSQNWKAWASGRPQPPNGT